MRHCLETLRMKAEGGNICSSSSGGAVANYHSSCLTPPVRPIGHIIDLVGGIVLKVCSVNIWKEHT